MRLRPVLLVLGAAAVALPLLAGIAMTVILGWLLLFNGIMLLTAASMAKYM